MPTPLDAIVGLARSAELVLGLPAGELELVRPGPALARLGERLAERNLGLVRVRDADSFAWPGHWLGILEAEGGGRRAVVLFGVPSAIVEAPGGGSLGTGGTLVDGYVIAPLDLHRGHGAGAYAAATGSGTVEGIFTAADRGAPCRAHAECAVLPGRGLVGDRYADGRGTFSADGRGGQDLTLIEGEALVDLATAGGVSLTPADARRNVVTRGIRLEALIGLEFTIGEVRCRGARLAEPCAHLERLTSPGVLRGLVHRGGIRADVRSAGTIRRGDEIRPGPDPAR